MPYGPHAARNSFRNCRKCCNSPTSNIFGCNWRSRIFFKLQQNEVDFAARDKFMLVNLDLLAF